MNNIVFVNFECNETNKIVSQKIWQWSYGQILRIQGLDLPAAVEIHFSLQKTGGAAKRRIGVTRDGVTDVVIPDFILTGEGIERNYSAYAFVYLSDEESGQTEHRIELNITSRPEPEGSSKEDDTSFGAIMDAVNKIAEQNGQGVSDEKIAEAVNAYMEANPVEGNVTVDTELSETSTNPVANSTVTKKFSQLSDTVNDLKEDVENVGQPTDEQIQTAVDSYLGKNPISGGLTNAQKNSLVAVINAIGVFNVENGQELIDAFNNAWTTSVPATGITLNKSTLSFTDSTSQTLVATVYPSDTTDKVVWSSNNNSVATVTNGVVKPLSNGSSMITATSGSVSATCEVTVAMTEEEQVTLTSISAIYTGGSVAVGTDVNSLTGIKVTGHYSDGSTANITDYTLSGEIVEGSNTITVTYEGVTTTFAVVGIAVTITGISAVSNEETYPVGTTYANTDITVLVNYSNGKSEEISDYTILDSEKVIVEGENTITIIWIDGTNNYKTTLTVIGVVVKDLWLNNCTKTASYGSDSIDVVVTDHNHVKLTANTTKSGMFVDISNATQTIINTNIVNMGLSAFATKYTIPAGATVETTVTWVSVSFVSYAGYEFLAVPTGETNASNCIELLKKSSIYGPNIPGTVDTNTITIENETEINAILEWEQSRAVSKTSEFTLSIKVNGEEILGVV